MAPNPLGAKNSQGGGSSPATATGRHEKEALVDMEEMAPLTRDLDDSDGIASAKRSGRPVAHSRRRGWEIPEEYLSVASCFFYTFCSITMVLANKGLASKYKANIDLLTIAFQSLCAVGLVEISSSLGLIQLGTRFQMNIAVKWLPVNCFFVSMLVTGFLSLRYLNIPMVTIFKNLTNIGIMWGEWYFQGQSVSWGAILSCFIMVLGAFMAAANDITFSTWGYFWMMANCFSTASYVLYMKHATKTIYISKFGMVFYNNLLSLPLLLVGALVRGEFQVFFSRSDLHNLPYLMLSLYAGFVGFFLNLATLWCVSHTTATTYAVVGALNKIPTAIIGYFLFKTPMTSQTWVFIAVSMLGGFLYTAAKLHESKTAPPVRTTPLPTSKNDAS